MTDASDLAEARQELARRQAQLVAALVAGAPVPSGFDSERLRIQADALVSKRLDVVAKVRPDLVHDLGPEFRRRFTEYAQATPRPGGARADADAFAAGLGGTPSEPPPARNIKLLRLASAFFRQRHRHAS